MFAIVFPRPSSPADAHRLMPKWRTRRVTWCTPSYSDRLLVPCFVMVREILEDTHEEDEEGGGIDVQAQSKMQLESFSKRFRALGVEDEEGGGKQCPPHRLCFTRNDLLSHTPQRFTINATEREREAIKKRERRRDGGREGSGLVWLP